jgi:transketolase
MTTSSHLNFSEVMGKEYLTESNRLRGRILKAAIGAGGGHIGGSFSVIDLLYYLFRDVLRNMSAAGTEPNRDRLILSKGHSCLALYACLDEFGFIQKDELFSFLELDSRLAGHSEHFLIPAIEITTGSLGHGLGVGAGMALAGKMNSQQWKTFCIVGDGECNEGSIWESFMFIAQHKLNNLITFIDSNKQESLDFTKNILSIEPIKEKIEAFGLNAIEIDGHSFQEISKSINQALESDIPTVIICHTVKGKGVDFMEGVMKWHYRAPSEQELNDSLIQLGN